jgi:hypothetical protein
MPYGYLCPSGYSHCSHSMNTLQILLVRDKLGIGSHGRTMGTRGVIRDIGCADARRRIVHDFRKSFLEQSAVT